MRFTFALPPIAALVFAASPAFAWDAGTATVTSTDAGQSADLGAGPDTAETPDAGVDADAGEDPWDSDSPDVDELPPDPPKVCDSVIEDSYTVTLHPSADGYALAEYYESTYAADFRYVYSDGFAGHIPVEAMMELSSDSNVANIENNRVACGGQVALPDLRISAMRSTFSNAARNQDITTVATVTNFGAATSPAARITFWRNRPAVPTTATPKQTVMNLDPLAPGASQTVTFVTRYAADGVFTIRALADSHAQVYEGAASSAAEKNNHAATTVRVRVNNNRRPDLIVRTMTAPGPRLANTPVTVRVWVRNRGNFAAGRFEVSLYQHLTSAPDVSTAKDLSLVVGSLGVNKEVVLTFNPVYTTPGTFRIWALADSFHNANELIETNNSLEAPAIEIQPPPDLQITSFTTHRYFVATDEVLLIGLTQTNFGVTAGASQVGLYTDLADPPGISTPESFTFAAPSLPMNGSASFNQLVSYPNNFAADQYIRRVRLWGLADCNDHVVESNESNGGTSPIDVLVSVPQSHLPLQNHFNDVAFPYGVVWSLGHLSSAVSGDGAGEVDATIAVIDSGIAIGHPELNVVEEERMGFGQPVNADDEHGHGTHVAGIIAARDNSFGHVGMAPGARLWALRVLDENNQGQLIDLEAALRHVRDRVLEGADVRTVNVSIDGGVVSAAINNLIVDLSNLGVAVIVAAGNQATSVLNSPAAEPRAITVASLSIEVNPANRAPVDSYFSPRSNWGDGIDVIAPGAFFVDDGTPFDEGLFSTAPDDTYAKSMGTSMAAPHVAGLFALIAAAQPASTVEARLQQVINTAWAQQPGRHSEARTYPIINADPF